MSCLRLPDAATLGAPLLVLLAACNLCRPTPADAGPCTSDADCQPGFACFAGGCQSLSQVLQNLSAVVTPPPGDLAPEQYQAIDGTQSSLTLTLGASQLWDLNIPVPPTCTREQALPITLRFSPAADAPPIIPLLDWTFTFTTDIAGNVHGALPAPGQFVEWIEPATPCVAPIVGPDLSAPGNAPVPVFPTSTLTVVGALSVAGSSGNYSCPAGRPCTYGGASVTIKSVQKSVQGLVAGQPISGTVTSLGGPPGTIGFALPLALPTESSCPPPPAATDCDGGLCPAEDNCVSFILEVGPSAANPQLLLPTIDLPISGRFAFPPQVDGGVPVGPVLSLMGEDGLGVQLPLGPKQLVNVTGTVLQPNQTQLPSAEVTVTCAAPDGGDICPQGYSYRLITVTGENGSGQGGFALQVPPDADFTVTATPPPGYGLAPVSVPLSVPSDVSDAGITDLVLQIHSGYLLSGTILDPTSTFAISAGQVQATSLSTGALVGTTALQSGGTFQLTLPPGQYMVLVQPAASTGLPDWSHPVALVGDTDLGPQPLYPSARLGGGIFAEPLDGGTYPVAQASVQLYFITETQAFGKVALPIASGITDQQGHFSVAVPSSSAAASN